jgi:GST-like protein
MLEECGLPYNVISVNIGQGDQFKPEFLAIAPNNRMPAIVDYDTFDGAPLSIFESGAILQYLARKTGKFYGKTEREKIAVDEWVMWQMGGLGPMAGQCHHFRIYAPEKIDYAINRYTNEVNRLYGVMNKELAKKQFLACNEVTIADFMCIGWAKLWERQGQDITQFPHLERWINEMLARPGVIAGMDVNKGDRKPPDLTDKKRFELLFNQKAN